MCLALIIFRLKLNYPLLKEEMCCIGKHLEARKNNDSGGFKNIYKFRIKLLL